MVDPVASGPPNVNLDLWLRRGDGSKNYMLYAENEQGEEEYRKVKKLVEEERLACSACKHAGMRPSHDKTIIMSERIYTRQCPSNGRWYDPTTGEMAGYAHCTCDECF